MRLSSFWAIIQLVIETLLCSLWRHLKGFLIANGSNRKKVSLSTHANNNRFYFIQGISQLRACLKLFENAAASYDTPTLSLNIIIL